MTPLVTCPDQAYAGKMHQNISERSLLFSPLHRCMVRNALWLLHTLLSRGLKLIPLVGGIWQLRKDVLVTLQGFWFFFSFSIGVTLKGGKTPYNKIHLMKTAALWAFTHKSLSTHLECAVLAIMSQASAVELSKQWTVKKLTAWNWACCLELTSDSGNHKANHAGQEYSTA